LEKSILIIGINYFPEITGIGKYTAEMAEYLSLEKQFEVTVITGNPYYPQWRIYDGYKNNIHKEIINGITVYRTPVYIPSRPRTISDYCRTLYLFAAHSVYLLTFY
jgi:colanic acid biosynthesis glycosyl transferase WcaI